MGRIFKSTQAQVRRNLVGAIDGQVQLGRLIERGEWDAKMLGIDARRLRGRNADHVEAGTDSFGQQRNEVARR